MTVAERDLRLMFRLVKRPDDADGPEPIPWSVLIGLRDLIGCTAVNFTLIDSQRRTVPFGQQVGPDLSCPDDVAEGLEAAFWRHYPSSPPCSYPDTSGDLVSVTTTSDFWSDRQLRASPLFNEFLRYGCGPREMMVCLPSQVGLTLRLLFWRGAGADFTERDRSLLALLRPHLHQAHQDRRRRQVPATQLSARQTQLMELVAAGYTNQQIARRLSISEATVRKHLEHIFDRLQVTNRTSAVTQFRVEPPPTRTSAEPQEWFMPIT